jgi:hypothetical protein
LSTAPSRRRLNQKLTVERTAEWLRATRERRRVAFTVSRQQRRDALARTGLHPVGLPSLDDALAEVNPPCL